MRGCDVMLVMIGKNWNPERLKYENDGVRFEFDHAKTLQCKVIPVILEEAVMPHPEELPPEFGHITYILGLPFRWQSANDDATRIIELVKSYRKEAVRSFRRHLRPSNTPSPVPVKGVSSINEVKSLLQRPPTGTGNWVADVPPLPPLPPPDFRPSRRRRQPRTLAIVGATAAVLICGIVIAALIGGYGSSTSTPTTPVPSSAVTTTPPTTTPTTTTPTATTPTTTAAPTTESVTFVATTIAAPPVTTVAPIPIQQASAAQEAPEAPPAQTMCIRSDIDFAALREAPDLAGELLAQIPPGSCDVILMEPTPVQGKGSAGTTCNGAASLVGPPKRTSLENALYGSASPGKPHATGMRSGQMNTQTDQGIEPATGRTSAIPTTLDEN